MHKKHHILSAFILLYILLVSCTKQEEVYAVHTRPVKLADYLYEISYSDYSSSMSTKDALTMERFSLGGACTVVHAGDLVGRNYDYLYGDMAEFVIHVSAAKDRFASIGIASSLFDLTVEKTENDPNGSCFDILPYVTVDGINEKGVFCEINMVEGDSVCVTTGTNPDAPETLYYTQVVRYVLDHCSSAAEACEALAKKNIVFSGILGEFHYMIADRTDTFIIEVFDNKFVCRRPKENILTNFYVLTDKFQNDDDPGIHPEGIERYQIVRDHYSELQSKDKIGEVMELVKYSRMYDTSNVPYFYSEFYGDYIDGEQIGVNTPKEDYADMIEEECELYRNRSRNYLDGIWITTHTSIYDLKNLTLRVYAQENYADPIDFVL